MSQNETLQEKQYLSPEDQMIVGKCQNPASGYDAVERQTETATQNGGHGDVRSVQVLAPREKLYNRGTSRLSRPDTFFVAQLIATAEQAPQTRVLRRASVMDTMSYYDAVTKVISGGSRVTGRLSRVV